MARVNAKLVKKKKSKCLVVLCLSAMGGVCVCARICRGERQTEGKKTIYMHFYWPKQGEKPAFEQKV